MKMTIKKFIIAAAVMLGTFALGGVSAEAAGRISATMIPKTEVKAGETTTFEITVTNQTKEDVEPGALGAMLQMFVDDTADSLETWEWSGEDFLAIDSGNDTVLVNQKTLKTGGSLKASVSGKVPSIWRGDDNCAFIIVLVDTISENGGILDVVYYMNLPYKDAKMTDWYFNGVASMYHFGIMTGKSESYFAPMEKLARGQFATMLWRMAAPETETPYDSAKFPDVRNNEFFTVPAMWASENGIITGYASNGYFGPADAINREQIAVMLYRYAQYEGFDVSVKGDLSAFADGNKVSDYAKEAMEWAVGTGLISGDGTGRLNPQGTAIRAEAAAMISRFCYQIAFLQ